MVPRTSANMCESRISAGTCECRIECRISGDGRHVESLQIYTDAESLQMDGSFGSFNDSLCSMVVSMTVCVPNLWRWTVVSMIVVSRIVSMIISADMYGCQISVDGR